MSTWEAATHCKIKGAGVVDWDVGIDLKRAPKEDHHSSAREHSQPRTRLSQKAKFREIASQA